MTNIKELSIEQKAKRYDEVIEIAKKWRNAPNVNKIPTFANRVIEEIFPELAESEDERVRNEIVRFIQMEVEDEIVGNKWIAWLEKQESVGEIVERCKTSWYNEGKIQGQIEGLSDEEKYQQGWHDALEKQGEQKLTNSYCQEHCKGFQETGKCFADGDCKAKTTYKDEPKEDNRPVTERIKTFDDARQELDTKALSGDETAAFLLADYESNADNINNPQTLAYMRLAIIAYALNEGWEPKFEKGEYRYFPWFHLYTKEQYDKLDDKEKGCCVLRSGVYMNSYNGFVYVNAHYVASHSSSSYGSRLVFRTRELAAYAGRQFIEEWADFVFNVFKSE